MCGKNGGVATTAVGLYMDGLLNSTAAWMAEPYNEDLQQAMVHSIWVLVRLYLTKAPDDLTSGIKITIQKSLIHGTFFGLFEQTWSGFRQIVIVHPDVLYRYGFVLDLTKIFVLIVGHELVHAWQYLHENTLRSRLLQNSSWGCFMEAYATTVMNTISREHKLWLQNEAGLALLRFTDATKTLLPCYYDLSKKFATALQAWGNLDKITAQKWVLRKNSLGKPEAISVIKVKQSIITKFSAKTTSYKQPSRK